MFIIVSSRRCSPLNPSRWHSHRACAKHVSIYIDALAPVCSRTFRVYVRYVPDPVLLLQAGDDFFGELAHNLCSINSFHVAINSLPLGDPRAARVGHGDEPFKDGRCARFDGFLGALEVEVFFAVGAPFFLEALHQERNISERGTEEPRWGKTDGQVYVHSWATQLSRPCRRALPCAECYRTLWAVVMSLRRGRKRYGWNWVSRVRGRCRKALTD